MIKLINVIIFGLALISMPLFANSNYKILLIEKTNPKSESVNEKNTPLKKWEASSDGIQYKKWKTSTEGKKVQGSYEKIKKNIQSFSPMNAKVISVTYQRPNSKVSGPKWIIVQIQGEQYMMQYVLKDFVKLKSIKINDKIIVKSHSAGLSPNHPYLILSGDYIAKNNTVLFKRDLNKNNRC